MKCALPIAAAFWLWLSVPLVTGYAARATIAGLAIVATLVALYSIGARLGAWSTQSERDS